VSCNEVVCKKIILRGPWLPAGFADLSGRKIDLRHVNPLSRDILRHLHARQGASVRSPCSTQPGRWVERSFSPPDLPEMPWMWCASNPSPSVSRLPGQPSGPLVTFVFEAISEADDKGGRIGAGGWMRFMKAAVNESSDLSGVTWADCRFVPLTRVRPTGGPRTGSTMRRKATLRPALTLGQMDAKKKRPQKMSLTFRTGEQ
jgi:hypothetical protein